MSLEQGRPRSCSGLHPPRSSASPDRGTIRARQRRRPRRVRPQDLPRRSHLGRADAVCAGRRSTLFINGVAAVAEGKPGARSACPGRALRLDQGRPREEGDPQGRPDLDRRPRPTPRAEALAIRDGVLMAVGSVEEGGSVPRAAHKGHRIPDRLRHAGPDRRPRPHGGPRGLARRGRPPRCVSRLDEVARRVKAKMVDATPGDGWIIGHSFDQSRVPRRAPSPTRQHAIDKVAPEAPRPPPSSSTATRSGSTPRRSGGRRSRRS